jgi:hypothetical protein
VLTNAEVLGIKPTTLASRIKALGLSGRPGGVKSRDGPLSLLTRRPRDPGAGVGMK